MGQKITVYLTDGELDKMKELCAAYGEDNKSRIVKIAISELHVNCDTLAVHRPAKNVNIIETNPIDEVQIT